MSGSGKGTDDSPFDFDPKADLLNRYKTMVQTQIDTIDGIDNKAANTARLVAGFAGLILTALSFTAGNVDIEISGNTAPALVLLACATVAFFSALSFSILTYLSSVFEYGPSADLGKAMAGKKVPEEEYKDVLLRGYRSALKKNRRVVITNARRFQKALLSLLIGVLWLVGAGTLLLIKGLFYLTGVFFLAYVLGAIVLWIHVCWEGHLTLDRQLPDDD